MVQTSGYDNVKEYLIKKAMIYIKLYYVQIELLVQQDQKLVFYFSLRKERKDVISISETKRSLIFCNTHLTKNVKFYNFNIKT